MRQWAIARLKVFTTSDTRLAVQEGQTFYLSSKHGKSSTPVPGYFTLPAKDYYHEKSLMAQKDLFLFLTLQ